MKFITLNSVFGGKIEVNLSHIVTMRNISNDKNGTRLTLTHQSAPFFEDVTETRAEIRALCAEA